MYVLITDIVVGLCSNVLTVAPDACCLEVINTACRAIWPILREAASHGPSALADALA